MIDSVTNNTIKDGIALLLYVVGTAPIPTPCHCQVTAPFLKLLSVLKPCLPCLRVRNEGFFSCFCHRNYRNRHRNCKYGVKKMIPNMNKD